jgi:hypothetical protein
MSEQNPDQSKKNIFCNDPASTLAVSSYDFFSGTHSFALEKIHQSLRPSKFWRKRNSQRNIVAIEPDINSTQVPVD